MQLIRRFSIAEHEDIWHNQQLNVEIILIFCFCDKLVVQGPKGDLIIALLEVYIGKKSFFLKIKCAKLMYKKCRNYIKICISH